MTKANVTISYGHGKLYDGKESETSLFSKIEDGQTLAALVSYKDDAFDIEATNSGGNKVGYYRNTANLGLSSTAYTKIRGRYKCSNGSVKAKVVIEFGDASGQIVLAAVNSTTWKVFSAAITTGLTIDHIWLECNEAVGHVYYDFIMIYKGDFTLPNTRFSRHFEVPMRNPKQDPPGMFGAITQNLGSELASVEILADLDQGTWTRTADTMPGQVFLDIAQGSDDEDWQWIDMGDLVAQFRVTMDKPDWQYSADGSEARHALSLKFTEYTRMDLAGWTEVERFALDV
jgi:hypothetical protein